jgi:hypothetical protein
MYKWIESTRRLRGQYQLSGHCQQTCAQMDIKSRGKAPPLCSFADEACHSLPNLGSLWRVVATSERFLSQQISCTKASSLADPIVWTRNGNFQTFSTLLRRLFRPKHLWNFFTLEGGEDYDGKEERCGAFCWCTRCALLCVNCSYSREWEDGDIFSQNV